ncbi:MAG TPA: hypothetical protein P5346_17775 [Spirochaetota bacterium]|nr:hypothetical protein [Spirochaetota bacterium]
MKNSSSTDKGRSFWQVHVKAQAESGLTQREYCRQNNISYWSFNPWKRRIENGRTGFHEISPAIVQGLPDENKRIEITVNDTIRISVPVGFSSDTLSEILNILGVMR